MCYLEFSGVDHFPGTIAELEYVYTTVEIRNVNDGVLVDRRQVKYFFSNKIIYLETIGLAGELVDIKSDLRNRRVGIEAGYPGNRVLRWPVGLAFQLS